jgi:arginine deiminase
MIENKEIERLQMEIESLKDLMIKNLEESKNQQELLNKYIEDSTIVHNRLNNHINFIEYIYNSVKYTLHGINNYIDNIIFDTSKYYIDNKIPNSLTKD